MGEILNMVIAILIAGIIWIILNKLYTKYVEPRLTAGDPLISGIPVWYVDQYNKYMNTHHANSPDIPPANIVLAANAAAVVPPAAGASVPPANAAAVVPPAAGSSVPPANAPPATSPPSVVVNTNTIPTPLTPIIAGVSKLLSNVPSGTTSANTTAGALGTTAIEQTKLNTLEGLTTSNKDRSDCNILHGAYGYAKIETDGNLVIYTSNGNKPIWTTGMTPGTQAPYSLIIHTDGNLVIYNTAGTPVWTPNTAYIADGPFYLVLKKSGNLVLYAEGGNSILWQSDTAGLIGTTPNPDYNNIKNTWNCLKKNIQSSTQNKTDNLYAIDDQNNFYIGDRLNWKKDPDNKFKNISYRDNTRFGITPDNLLSQYGATGWVKSNQKLKQVSAGCPNKSSWGVDDPGVVYKQSSNGWDKVDSSPMSYVAAGSQDDVWGIDKKNILWNKGTAGWTQQNTTDNLLKQVDVGCDGEIWGVGVRGDVYTKVGDTWRKIGDDKLKMVKVRNRSIAGITEDGDPVSCTKPCTGTWSPLGYPGGALMQL